MLQKYKALALYIGSGKRIIHGNDLKSKIERINICTRDSMRFCFPHFSTLEFQKYIYLYSNKHEASHVICTRRLKQMMFFGPTELKWKLKEKKAIWKKGSQSTQKSVFSFVSLFSFSHSICGHVYFKILTSASAICDSDTMCLHDFCIIFSSRSIFYFVLFTRFAYIFPLILLLYFNKFNLLCVDGFYTPSNRHTHTERERKR